LPDATVASGLTKEPTKPANVLQAPFVSVASARSTRRLAALSPEPPSVPLPVVKATDAVVNQGPAFSAIVWEAGSVWSIVTSRMSLFVELVLSVTVAFSERSPSGSTAQDAEYGAQVSMPSETQLPLAQAALIFVQRKNSTWSTVFGHSADALAVIVNGLASAALT
jgi:hypothetical protein